MIHESADAGVVEIPNLTKPGAKSVKPGKVVNSKPTDERIYNTSHATIGRAIVLNHMKFNSNDLPPRESSANDVLALRKQLTALGFDFTSHDDLSVAEIQKLIAEAAIHDYSNTSCLMIFVLTHGDSDGILHAKDGDFNVKELYEPLLRNTSLHGKPKMFFLQACRGGFSDFGVIAKTTAENQLIDSTDAKASYDGCYTIPTYADMLIHYSTIEGIVSFKNDYGSWFIQNFCEELSKNLHEDLLSILTYVNNRVAYDKQSRAELNKWEYDLSKQMPVVKHTLTKKLFLKRNSSNGEIASTKTDIDVKCKTCGREG